MLYEIASTCSCEVNHTFFTTTGRTIVIIIIPFNEHTMRFVVPRGDHLEIPLLWVSCRLPVSWFLPAPQHISIACIYPCIDNLLPHREFYSPRHRRLRNYTQKWLSAGPWLVWLLLRCYLYCVILIHRRADSQSIAVPSHCV